jgi:hypothetical protein
MKQINRYLKMSRKDNMLVENRIFSSYRRPVRDGMWEKENNHFYCLNQDSQDLRMNRMRKIEIKNTTTGSVAAIYTLSLWHYCRDAMLRVFFGDKRKRTNPVRYCRFDPQRREASRLYISGDSDISDKRRRMDEGTKEQKIQATSISSWLACLLLVACCLLPYKQKFKSNL